MTNNKKKSRARAISAKTGMSYQAAINQLDGNKQEAPKLETVVPLTDDSYLGWLQLDCDVKFYQFDDRGYCTPSCRTFIPYEDTYFPVQRKSVDLTFKGNVAFRSEKPLEWLGSSYMGKKEVEYQPAFLDGDVVWYAPCAYRVWVDDKVRLTYEFRPQTLKDWALTTRSNHHLAREIIQREYGIDLHDISVGSLSDLFSEFFEGKSIDDPISREDANLLSVDARSGGVEGSKLLSDAYIIPLLERPAFEKGGPSDKTVLLHRNREYVRNGSVRSLRKPLPSKLSRLRWYRCLPSGVSGTFGRKQGSWVEGNSALGLKGFRLNGVLETAATSWVHNQLECLPEDQLLFVMSAKLSNKGRVDLQAVRGSESAFSTLGITQSSQPEWYTFCSQVRSELKVTTRAAIQHIVEGLKGPQAEAILAQLRGPDFEQVLSSINGLLAAQQGTLDQTQALNA